MTAHSLILSKPGTDTNCTIELTGSKSESNRALILNALSQGKVQVRNLSSADDTVVLSKSLADAASYTGRGEPLTVNIGPAGTAMRFLSAYFAVTGAKTLLTGSERMKQRPIGILVDALRQLGADITYAEAAGYPPLLFPGNFRQKSAGISIRGNVSSQYITALLLVASSLPQGLELHIEGELTSRPYVEMTLAMLGEAGIRYEWSGSRISIARQDFQNATLTVEPDWSAASYWYSIAALSESSIIELPWLKQNSLQGDSRISSVMENFGIYTTFTEHGLRLEKKEADTKPLFFDLKDCPDLAQTVVVCCAGLGRDASFTGLETLKIKETDRIKALQNELSKIGVELREENEVYHLSCSSLHFPDRISIATYEDHRMAMAFAPLALRVKELEIQEPAVVGKSYPSFWEDLKKAGFTISY